MTKLFQAITGSQAYGTNIPGSDTDYKGFYHADTAELFAFNRIDQISPNKDELYYEVRRLLEFKRHR